MPKTTFANNADSSNIVIILKERFDTHMARHPKLKWNEIEKRLTNGSINALVEMEKTGGEPDILEYQKEIDKYIFCDCSLESPNGRRSLCYDNEALESRKEARPIGSVLGMCGVIGVELLDEKIYRKLQEVGEFDLKTSSWLLTPSDIRSKGGAIFGDKRYGHVFIYHNGAESYYGARGFRALIRI